MAQDIEKSVSEAKNLFKADPVSITGSIGANAVGYKSYGIQPRRDPFYWTINANLSVSLFNKVSVPFTAVITQQDKNYTNGLDKFSQHIESYPDNSVIIFDQWNQKVFETRGYKNTWAGVNQKGDILPDATYYYILRFGGDSGKKYTGYITLMRNKK